MLAPVLTFKIQSDHSLVTLRDRCRQVGELFGLELLQRTRLTTAVSEVGRNALQHADGAIVHFLVGASRRPGSQAVLIRVVDKGPGIAASVWAGGALTAGRTGGGLQGSQRLVDDFWIETSAGKGTSVSLEMHLRREAAHLTTAAIQERVDELVRRKPKSPREELEQQNREMLHTLEELRQRQVELEEADRRKNEFVAMLAHELRNPLSAIAMTVEVLRLNKRPTPQEIAQYGGLIARQTNQLTKLINDLMDVSRISRGQVRLDREVISVDRLLTEAVEMTRASLDAKAHIVTVTLPADPVFVDVDLVRMKQVISNLVHNAARYSPHRGSIDVGVRREGERVSIAVKDDGIGIDGEMLPKVFDLFAQASNGLSREGSGLGVGLTIVQRLVVDHGGTVTASSRGLGTGSEFVVTLDTVPVPSPEAEPVLAATPPQLRTRVLVVDDNEDSAESLCTLLLMSGYECIAVGDGLAGIAAAREHAPQFALVDIGLPLMDGFGVADELRRLFGSRITLVAMSGYSSQDIQGRAMEAGFDDFLVKPVDLSTLARRLETVANGLPAGAGIETRHLSHG
jgi:signal transduction histidine kinase/ActR/RegA family two-component response regulator